VIVDISIVKFKIGESGKLNPVPGKFFPVANVGMNRIISCPAIEFQDKCYEYASFVGNNPFKPWLNHL
jgi:hypothetical protein